MTVDRSELEALAENAIRVGQLMREWWLLAVGREPTREEAHMAIDAVLRPRSSTPVTDDELMRRVDQLAERLGVSNPARDGRL